MQITAAVPDNVRQMLENIVSAAKNAFAGNLRCVVLYGSAAEGRLRASSDVNLLFVLSEFKPEQADPFREIYRFTQSAVDLTAMFILQDELPAAEESFAQKFADIRRRHVVLHGEDPFTMTAIPRDTLVRRLRQVLLNLTIRAREMYVERSLREEQCAVTVAEVAGPLRAFAASILELETGAALPPKEALQKLVDDVGRADFQELLPHLSEARERRALPPGRGAAILFQTVALVRAVYDRALRL